MQVLFRHGDTLCAGSQQADVRLAAQRCDPPFQNADAGLPRIIPNQCADGPVLHPELRLFQSMLLQLLGKQMVFGDLQLLLVRIAAKLDHLHPVQQGPGDGFRGIGGGDEHDLAQVHRNLHEMIPEGAVLFPVQHLQQRRGRVAPVIVAQLIDLVQQQQRVHRLASADGLNDAPGHGAYVGLPVAPDIRLVPNAAQTQPGQLPVQRLGNADGDGGLAHAGRAHQTENLPLPLRVHLPDGNGLHDALLHFIQSKMVSVQDLSGGLHAQPLLGGGIPRHFQTHVQIVADDRALGAGIGLLRQLIHLFDQVGFRILRQLQLKDTHAVVLQLLIAVVALAQLTLHHPDLCAQDLLPLGPGQLGAHLVLHLPFEGQNVVLPRQKFIQLPQADIGGRLLQNTLPLLRPQLDVLGQKVRKISRVPVFQHLRSHAVRQAGHPSGILFKQHGGLAQKRLRPGAVQERLGVLLLRQRLHIGL